MANDSNGPILSNSLTGALKIKVTQVSMKYNELVHVLSPKRHNSPKRISTCFISQKIQEKSPSHCSTNSCVSINLYLLVTIIGSSTIPQLLPTQEVSQAFAQADLQIRFSFIFPIKLSHTRGRIVLVRTDNTFHMREGSSGSDSETAFRQL